MLNNCLIELGTEELPPKALKSLSQSLGDLLRQGLEDSGLTPPSTEVFATPRRLAVLFRDLPLNQPDQSVEKRGPAVKAAFDADGNPSKAALGFARGCGVAVEALAQRETDKGAWLFFEKTESGLSLAELLPDILKSALARLPIPRRMRWGSGDAEFIRPLKWLVVMIGDQVVDCEVFGIKSSASTHGHRFHAPDEIEIKQAHEYENTLLTQGMVMGSFEKRQATIKTLVEKNATQLGGVAHIDDDLLEEVTALVEYPVAVTGGFDEAYLAIPQEVLVMTMQDNQKYFAVFDIQKKLMPHFITISNVDSKKPEVIARGNERVIRPRFGDAEFFYQQDQKQTLASFRSRLDTVVFQEQLGSIGDKVERLAQLAGSIAKNIGADQVEVKQAAQLCKNDLMTDMIGEFPKLQGVMGRYYADHDNAPAVVSAAIEQHYWPKFAGHELPESDIGQCLALADRLDSLVGIFAIGQKPSGVKDPFALRRAALSVVRILIEKELDLDIYSLCHEAAENLAGQVSAAEAVEDVVDYIFDRLKSYYQDQGIEFDIVEAVLAVKPTVLRDFDQRVKALKQFQSNAAAAALAAANKRISNILRKQSLADIGEIDECLLIESAEKQLSVQLASVKNQATEFFDNGDYFQGLELLAQLRPEVDAFFDDVMVMVDDEATKNNRLALLDQLLQCFRRVADFSRIQS